MRIVRIPTVLRRMLAADASYDALMDAAIRLQDTCARSRSMAGYPPNTSTQITKAVRKPPMPEVEEKEMAGLEHQYGAIETITTYANINVPSWDILEVQACANLPRSHHVWAVYITSGPFLSHSLGITVVITCPTTINVRPVEKTRVSLVADAIVMQDPSPAPDSVIKHTILVPIQSSSPNSLDLVISLNTSSLSESHDKTSQLKKISHPQDFPTSNPIIRHEFNLHLSCDHAPNLTSNHSLINPETPSQLGDLPHFI